MKWQYRLVLLCSALALLLPARSQQARADVREFVRADAAPRAYRELTAAYDATVVPQLIEILNSPTEKATHARAAALLGAVGDERATDALIAFVERPVDNMRLTVEEEAGQRWAIISLGYLVNRNGSERALKYLTEGLTPGVWRQRGVGGMPDWANSYDQYDLERSKHALFALALSGHSAAGSALRSLRDTPTSAQAQFRTGLDDTLAQWLEVYDLVAERGLAGMYEYYEAKRLAEGQQFAEEARRIREERQRAQGAPEAQNRPQ